MKRCGAMSTMILGAVMTWVSPVAAQDVIGYWNDGLSQQSGSPPRQAAARRRPRSSTSRWCISRCTMPCSPTTTTSSTTPATSHRAPARPSSPRPRRHATSWSTVSRCRPPRPRCRVRKLPREPGATAVAGGHRQRRDRRQAGRRQRHCGTRRRRQLPRLVPTVHGWNGPRGVAAECRHAGNGVALGGRCAAVRAGQPPALPGRLAASAHEPRVHPELRRGEAVGISHEQVPHARTERDRAHVLGQFPRAVQQTVSRAVGHPPHRQWPCQARQAGTAVCVDEHGHGRRVHLFVERQDALQFLAPRRGDSTRRRGPQHPHARPIRRGRRISRATSMPLSTRTTRTTRRGPTTSPAR